MINIPTFIKWAGGKRRLIKSLESLFPKKIDRYFEPFLGGGAVFFYIKQKYNPRHIMISDNNPELINTFKVVKTKPKELITKLSEHKKRNSKKYYYKIRAIDPKTLSKVGRAARFIYLNKTCFNGLYRVNSKGQFNVPIGRYKNPEIFNRERILLASSFLRKTQIKKQDFKRIENFAKKGDFIYFDPCYNPKIRTTIFNNYTKEGFLEKEQKTLAELFRRLNKRGCRLMLSNSNTVLVKKLYKDYRIKMVKCGRSINCKGDGRKKINEIVIMNY
jgi:DNA adenine methylase